MCKKTFPKSSQICCRAKTRKLKFIVIVNVYLCGKFLSSPELCTNRNCVIYVWIVLCLCMLTSGNISEIDRAAYFGYFSDILHTPHNLVPSALYHLNWWQKQICRFVGVIWVECSKVLFDSGCESCVWIAGPYLIGFLWCYFLALNWI